MRTGGTPSAGLKLKMSETPKPSTSVAKARVASKFGAGSTVWPRPMSPVTKRGTPCGETNGRQSERCPQDSSWRLPDGSVTTASACTPRWTQSAAEPCSQATPLASSTSSARRYAASPASSQPEAR
ncbi:hypothetical protein D3C76_397320 [compost metagenome]